MQPQQVINGRSSGLRRTIGCFALLGTLLLLYGCSKSETTGNTVSPNYIEDSVTFTATDSLGASAPAPSAETPSSPAAGLEEGLEVSPNRESKLAPSDSVTANDRLAGEMGGGLGGGYGRQRNSAVGGVEMSSGMRGRTGLGDGEPGAPADPSPEAALTGGAARELDTQSFGLMPEAQRAARTDESRGLSKDERERLGPFTPNTQPGNTPDTDGLETALRSKLAVKGLTLGRTSGERHVSAIELLPGEELWVIARSADRSEPRAVNPEIPGCGALMAHLPGEAETVAVPLKHTSVTGNIDGYIASVDVVQQFHNPYSSKIEAVYVFPLPENAAVNEFVMTIGERRIRGIIREREKAEQIYNEARAQGHVASLLTQERPNIFTQKVANIEPGKQIDISIRYFNTLRYDNGAYEFVFPMVVGPRYNPPHTTDGIGAVARGTHGVSGQSTEVSYLAPHERSGHDIALSVNIDAGVDICDVQSVNHAVDVKMVSECQRSVVLSSSDTVPNKDFVLRYRVADEQIKTAMLTHKDQHGQYFTMMLYPPAETKSVQRSPMEMVFVLDCSGSMNGRPIEQAKAAISHALQQLTPRDSFQIIQFSNTASQLGAAPVPATRANIEKGLSYLASFRGEGGTEMINGIKAALDFPHDEGRFRLVSFMTDGFIGNEQQILETMAQKMGESRIFSFGVGQSPNRYLMDRMAVLGRGAVTYLSLNDDAVQIMDGFQTQICHPAMTDLVVDFGDMQVTDVYPKRLPDLIVGRPIVITGRYTGEPSTVTVGGRIGMKPTSFAVSVNDEQTRDTHPGIAAVWARLKIADLMTAAARVPDQFAEMKTAVTQTALNYNLMSSFTSFVAVDSMTKTEGSFGTTVAVPVPVPEGVKYETTVSN